jgi:hypothetical protein
VAKIAPTFGPIEIDTVVHLNVEKCPTIQDNLGSSWWVTFYVVGSPAGSAPLQHGSTSISNEEVTVQCRGLDYEVEIQAILQGRETIITTDS